MHNQPISDDEPLARFALDKSYYRISDRTAKYNAFMPARTGDLSVFRVHGLNQGEISELGEKYVAGPQGKELRAYACVSAVEVRSQELSIVGTQRPHPRHANIVNWPGELKNRSIAQYLAECSVLTLINVE